MSRDAVAPLIAPSVLSADFARLGEEVQAIERDGADRVHVDVMDGRFVPTITIGPLVVASIARSTGLPLDVHLMIERPEEHVEAFVEAGAAWVSVHAEACIHLERTLQLIRELGCKAGVALNPSTPPDVLEWVLHSTDLVVVMSVNPGFGGQRLITPVLSKVKRISEMILRRGISVDIEVDGGVNSETAAGLCRSGANVLVAGSAVYGAPDEAGSYAQAISRIRQAAVVAQ